MTATNIILIKKNVKLIFYTLGSFFYYKLHRKDIYLKIIIINFKGM